MTRSTGCSGLIKRASPPSRARASRMAARSTTAGTPVKSWSSTRAVRNAISFSTLPFTSQLARARTSSGLTNLPSSFLSRFSRRILRLKGSLAAFPPASWERESSRKIVYCRPATSSVDRLPKEFGCVIVFFRTWRRQCAGQWARSRCRADIAARQADYNLIESCVTHLASLPCRRFTGWINRGFLLIGRSQIQPRRLNRVRWAMVYEVAVRRRPFDDGRQRVRLLLRVHRHRVGRQRSAQRAADALLSIDCDLHRPTRKDADPPCNAFLVVLAGVHRRDVASLEQLVGVCETEPTDVIDLGPDEDHRRTSPRAERRQLQRMHHRRRGAHVDRREPRGGDVVLRLQIA